VFCFDSIEKIHFKSDGEKVLQFTTPMKKQKMDHEDQVQVSLICCSMPNEN